MIKSIVENSRGDNHYIDMVISPWILNNILIILWQ